MNTQKILTLQDILKPVEKSLAIVEDLVMKNLETDIPLLTEVGQYILKSGGKRIRPAMLLLASGAFGEISEHACQAANVVEYIHTATLLHDDVVDNANLRRSKKSARSIWGNEASVLVGDYLFTVSFKFLATFQNLRVIEAMSRATTMMARGEILQLTRSYETATLKDYLEIVDHKTSSLMGAAMEIGAILGGAEESTQHSFYECGRHIGTCFQLIDDALDYEIDNTGLGKQAGTDLKERKITLPLSHLLGEASDQDRTNIIDILDEDIITDQHFSKVCQMIQKYGSLEYTIQQAGKFAEKAKKCLFDIPDNSCKQSIFQLIDFLVLRKK